MEVTVNGKPESLPDTLTVEQLLSSLNLEGKPCAVEVNKHIIRKPEHNTHSLTEGDTVEIVTFVGGG